jgi:predicted ATPase
MVNMISGCNGKSAVLQAMQPIHVCCCVVTACLCCRTHVNVISGRNGSGKSAVLQAMQAALGAKAKDTGRGDNMGALVRTGCQQASVKVRQCVTRCCAVMVNGTQ